MRPQSNELFKTQVTDMCSARRQYLSKQSTVTQSRLLTQKAFLFYAEDVVVFRECIGLRHHVVGLRD